MLSAEEFHYHQFTVADLGGEDKNEECQKECPETFVKYHDMTDRNSITRCIPRTGRSNTLCTIKIALKSCHNAVK